MAPATGAFALALIAAVTPARRARSTACPMPCRVFRRNRDQPIQIEAAELEMRDKKNEATFSGNVKGGAGRHHHDLEDARGVLRFGAGPRRAGGRGQGKGRESGARMQAAAPGPSGSSSIKRLEASGNVVVTQKDQVVTGDNAIFDTKTNLITMLGGIVLTQGKNVLRGDRLLVDMTTGVSRVESDSGRVQGLFQSSSPGGPLIPGAAPPPSPGPVNPNKPK